MTRKSFRIALAEMIGIDLSADQHAGLRVDIHHITGDGKEHTVRTVKARDLAKLLDEHAKELAHVDVCRMQQRIDRCMSENLKYWQRIQELEAQMSKEDTNTAETTGLSLHERLGKAAMTHSVRQNEKTGDVTTITYSHIKPSDIAAIEADLTAEATAPLRAEIDNAYRERNRLVAALTRFLPAYWAEDQNAGEGWRHVVYIDGPTGQLSWHVSDADFKAVIPRLRKVEGKPWDGHGAEEKYRRLASIPDHTFPRAENAALKIRNEKLKDQIVDLVAEAEVMREEAREWNDENDALKQAGDALRDNTKVLVDVSTEFCNSIGNLTDTQLTEKLGRKVSALLLALRTVATGWSLDAYDAATTPRAEETHDEDLDRPVADHERESQGDHHRQPKGTEEQGDTMARERLCPARRDRRIGSSEKSGGEEAVSDHNATINDAYAAYDADSRVGGPDGYEAFCDAVKSIWIEGYADGHSEGLRVGARNLRDLADSMTAPSPTDADQAEQDALTASAADWGVEPTDAAGEGSAE